MGSLLLPAWATSHPLSVLCIRNGRATYRVSSVAMTGSSSREYTTTS